jgi:hypothetical protein
MTTNLSRRSLLALGAGLGVGLGASTMLGGSALAKAPKLGTQTPYWHRFIHERLGRDRAGDPHPGAEA